MLNMPNVYLLVKGNNNKPTNHSTNHPQKNIYIKKTKLWELHLISLIFSVCVIFNNNWQSKKIKEHTTAMVWRWRELWGV